MFVVLSLLFILLPACGGGGEEATPTSTATSTATPTSTGTTKPTPTQSGQVKIGALQPWSGPAAIAGINYADPVIKTVEKEVQDMGGILGGRLLKVVRYDDRDSVADADAGAKKLIINDKVSALVFGGVLAPQCAAIAKVAAESKVLFVSIAPISTLVSPAVRESTLEATLSTRVVIDDTVKLITEVLKPRTVAILCQYGSDGVTTYIPGWKKGLEVAGIDVVYSELPPVDVQDFSPYLTKIKYLDPDVLILLEDSAPSISIAKQIIELGGWGHTQVVAMPNSLFAAKMPGAKGWLVMAFWHPGIDTPASVKFKEDFKAVIGRFPDSNHVFYYFSLWTAIHAIELAGTAEDTEAIIRAARSGNLEFDTPLGYAHYTTDGDPGLRGMFVEIKEGGTTVPFKQ